MGKTGSELLRLMKVWGKPAAMYGGGGALAGYAAGLLGKARTPEEKAKKARRRKTLTALGALAGAGGGLAQQAVKHIFANTAEFADYNIQRSWNSFKNGLLNPKLWRQPSYKTVNAREYEDEDYSPEAELLARSMGVWKGTPGKDWFMLGPAGNLRFDPEHKGLRNVMRGFEDNLQLRADRSEGGLPDRYLDTWPVFKDAYVRFKKTPAGGDEAVVDDLWDTALNSGEKVWEGGKINKSNLVRWLMSNTIWRNPAKVRATFEPKGGAWRFKA